MVMMSRGKKELMLGVEVYESRWAGTSAPNVAGQLDVQHCKYINVRVACLYCER